MEWQPSSRRAAFPSSSSSFRIRTWVSFRIWSIRQRCRIFCHLLMRRLEKYYFRDDLWLLSSVIKIWFLSKKLQSKNSSSLAFAANAASAAPAAPAASPTKYATCCCLQPIPSWSLQRFYADARNQCERWNKWTKTTICCWPDQCWVWAFSNKRGK